MNLNGITSQTVKQNKISLACLFMRNDLSWRDASEDAERLIVKLIRLTHTNTHEGACTAAILRSVAN